MHVGSCGCGGIGGNRTCYLHLLQRKKEHFSARKHQTVKKKYSSIKNIAPTLNKHKSGHGVFHDPKCVVRFWVRARQTRCTVNSTTSAGRASYVVPNAENTSARTNQRSPSSSEAAPKSKKRKKEEAAGHGF